MGYNKEYYQKNKEKFLEWQRQYRIKYKEKIRINRLRYDSEYLPKNREQILKKKKQYRLLNPDKIKIYRQRSDVKQKQRERQNTPEAREKKKIYAKKHYQLPEIRKKKLEYSKIHSQIPEVKARKRELERIRRRNNPKSNRRASYDLQDSMNNVRIRDKNTCQWQGCGLTFREVPIHVHHIFPRNEYPNLELIEQYMVCYCANHHGLFHRARGDPYSEMIPARYQERGIIDFQEGLDV